MQKYFLKLTKAGMPVPGIVPKISHNVKPRKVGERILNLPIGQAVNAFVWVTGSAQVFSLVRSHRISAMTSVKAVMSVKSAPYGQS